MHKPHREILWLLLACISWTAEPFAVPAAAADPAKVKSPIKSDEVVIFYPTRGWRVADEPDSDWEIDIHGCIFEPEESATGTQQLKQLTGIDLDQLKPDELQLLEKRAALFTVDHERGKAIPIRIGERVDTLPDSEANGHFQGRLTITAAQVNAVADNLQREIPFEAVLRPGDGRRMRGTVHLMPSSPAVHIVSDIDDTIKVSLVRDKSQLLLNTFCRPFRPAPGMADLYRRWSLGNVRFHYVSASPWQLYPPLAELIREHSFPSGTFQMKPFRVQDGTALSVLGSQENYKRNVIEPLLKQFSKDTFVLVGDTGEQDPTIYAGLARDYPQVIRILIRNVTNESPVDYRKTFEGLAAERWQLFDDPSEVDWTPGK